jgi:predicted transcriptional regulator
VDESARFPTLPSERVLHLTPQDINLGLLATVTKALGSDRRLAILDLLGANTCSVLEIAEALDLPQSTATQHINILENAGLIKTDLQPAKRGLQKICARVFDQIVIELPGERAHEETASSISMPIGAYVNAEVFPTCGLVSENEIIGHLDEPTAFYEPARLQAQLLWFRRGYIEYRFPSRVPPDATTDSLEISFEACSEAPLHHADWPSDITVWINHSEIGTWTSPADFGGERGALTPAWWDNSNSQYGLLKVWKVTPLGSFVDGVRASGIRLDDLKIAANGFIEVRIGVKADARNVGGINLFGSKFGNYPQDIVLKQRFQRGEVTSSGST